MKMNKLIYILIISFFITNGIHAQNDTLTIDSLRKDALKIFIDCNYCDEDFIREEIKFVNYVRDSKEAQLHILITKQFTGSGGEEYSLFFIGQKKFSKMQDTLKFYTNADDTDDEIRNNLVQMLKIGLIRYAAKTPLYNKILINFEQPSESKLVEDKWKSWLFEIDLGGWFNGEESVKYTSIWSSISASKITPEWKIEFYVYNNYNENSFKIENDTTIKSIISSQYFENQIVKSLGEHWSVGEKIDIYSSSYYNKKFQYNIYPAIEYNLFPYSQSTRKQLRFLYSAGYGYCYYNDTTIFNKTEEGLFGNELVIAFEIKEKWGSISTSIKGFNYFHDFSKNSLNLWTSLDLRIVKGLSFTISGNISLVHNQISLPKAGATQEEILLRKRQLATQYIYWGNIGITYTFGSIYNNVVNPRFGN